MLMRLYHFLSQDNAIKTLKNKRIKVSIINELNDPFEFLPRILGSNREANEKLFFKWKAEISKERGIVCFSKRWINPLLWSHYADKHEGFALGFDIPNDVLLKVKYRKKRLLFPWNSYPKDDKQTLPSKLRFVKELIKTKFSSWAYEEEFRYGCSLSDCIQEEGVYFENFDDSLILREVIAGCRSKPSKELLSLLDGFDNIKLITSKMDSDLYQIVPDL